jgi:hypothetical protein
MEVWRPSLQLIPSSSVWGGALAYSRRVDLNAKA